MPPPFWGWGKEPGGKPARPDSAPAFFRLDIVGFLW
jgi:hypothetical protein